MNNKKIKKWLEDTASDAMMKCFYYNLKECEDMPLKRFNKLMKDGKITKQMIHGAFNKAIEDVF